MSSDALMYLFLDRLKYLISPCVFVCKITYYIWNMSHTSFILAKENHLTKYTRLSFQPSQLSYHSIA